MRGSNFQGGLQGFLSLQARIESAAQTERAQRRAREQEEWMRTAKPSGQLGDGRLADLSDFERAGMLDANGLFYGKLNGRMLFFNGDGPLLTYGPVGSGKGRDLILPNIAHSRGRSLIVIDVKPELTWATINHRMSIPGHEVVVIDPFNTVPSGKYPKAQINPLRGLVDIVSQGQLIETEADEIATILLPAPAKAGDNSWIRDGAVRLLALRMEFLAMFDPENCRLDQLWSFVNSGDAELGAAFDMMETCQVAGIEGRAKAFRSVFKEAPKQFEAYRSDCQKAVASYEPGKTLSRATSAHTFDFARLKRVPTTVYITIPSTKLGVAAPWISMLISHAIETAATMRGPVPVTILADEVAQLPACPAILKAIQLYRGFGIQPWLFSQGRFTLETKWPREAVKEFEDQAAIMTMKRVQHPELIKDIMLWSGNETILGRSKSHNGGKIETAGDSLSETKRPVLQSENIMALGDRQIIRSAYLDRLAVCETLAYHMVDPWKHQIRDTRLLHSGLAGWD